MRITKQFFAPNISLFKSQLLQWSSNKKVYLWLDSNHHKDAYHSFDAVLALEEQQSLYLNTEKNAFNLLEQFQKSHQDYLFGYLTYDLKNDIESLDSHNFDGLNFPAIYFFQPKKIIFIKEHTITFSYLSFYKKEIDIDFNTILDIELTREVKTNYRTDVTIKQRISKTNYLKKAETIVKHLKRGDIYEVNFCMEFYLENTPIDPLNIFNKLNTISSPPFSSFLKLNDHYLCCASPERYIRKKGTAVISQPIKGTAKRGETVEKDEFLKKSLLNNPKEYAENIMIVDLVRNDLSKTAKKGSVKVEELCKLYTFKQVHQLISTIAVEIPEETSPITLLKNTFPMGSMTGAPKISAMKIIEEVEETKRGLYSGSVGYFTPIGDFDFNVVIRSILHNAANKYTSFSVGSAITALSNPSQEYEECLLKGKAMQQVLTDS